MRVRISGGRRRNRNGVVGGVVSMVEESGAVA